MKSFKNRYEERGEETHEMYILQCISTGRQVTTRQTKTRTTEKRHIKSSLSKITIQKFSD